MSVKVVGPVLGLSFLAAGCASHRILTDPIPLNDGTRDIVGWFSARGEWAVFPSPDMKFYNPYKTDENAKCVSVVNATGRPRSYFESLQGKRVLVHGHVANYDDLPDGDSPADKLLAKKYYGNDPVENFCLRQFVFIAGTIRNYELR